MKSGPCVGCGHSAAHHLHGVGLCLVSSCRLCLIFRPPRVSCVVCGDPVAALEVFPPPADQQGIRCLDCYAASPEGRRMPTAGEVTRAWGGR